MVTSSKRQYLRLAGASLAAVSLGVGGKLAADTALTSNVAATSEVSPAAKPGGSGSTPAASPAGDKTAPPAAASAGPSGDAAATNPQGTEPYGDCCAAGYVGPLDYERDDYGNVDFDWDGMTFETNGGDIDVEFVVDDVGIFIDFETKYGGTSLELTAVVGPDYVDLEVDENWEVEFEAAGPVGKFEDDNNEIEYRGGFIDLEWDPVSKDLELVIDGAKLEWNCNSYEHHELEYRGLSVQLDWESGFNYGRGEFEARRA
ncbi:hypothetical protein [Haloarchaeobius sp. DFWS5]|uniref:hypothetical protein n=1 Tax=Haloarchaeobius sp. DFWS5 TaxID=3446114 RepID=UPI003EB9AAC0